MSIHTSLPQSLVECDSASAGSKSARSPRACSVLVAAGFAALACRDRAPRAFAMAASASAASGPASIASDSASVATGSARSGARAFYADRFSRKPSVPAMTELGRRLFFDERLSASDKMACATCHDPRFGYGPPNHLATQLGGPDLMRPGLRAVPALRYLQALPPFSEHHFDEAVDESVDQGPTGGHGWDGRTDSAHDQARAPLTSPFEMANAGLPDVVDKVAHSSYAAEFQAAFGSDVFANAERGTAAILLSLEVFQQNPKDFYPYSSRYDAWLRHQGELSARELRGLALFDDPKKGNCASCHPSQIRAGAFPAFTDFGFAAIGVPRNPAIEANRDPHFFDLGLCGPLRTDLAKHAEYCGLFRVPSLRNVARRGVFFHNGRFARLDQVLAFYADRDTHPARWYSRQAGHVIRFDDLPPEARANVNREPPFGRKPNATPALSASEIHDIESFLETLTDADLLTN